MGKYRKQRQSNLIYLRRVSQLFFLLLFLVFFIWTDYRGTDSINNAVNIFFRLDPFLGACVILGAKTLIALFVPALFVLGVSFIFGRAFCGWFCPMGTLLDLSAKFFPTKKRSHLTYFPNLGMILLLFSLAAAVAGWGVGGYLDPFSVLVRGLAQAVYPWFNQLTTTFFTFTYTELPEWVNTMTEPVYAFMKQTVLPAEQKFFLLPYLFLLMLIAPLLLEGLQRRFFCRNVCPLGSLLKLFSFKGLLRGAGGDAGCGKCHLCTLNCRMGAIDDERRIGMGGCNLCFECVKTCPKQIIHFGYRNCSLSSSGNPREFFLSRRQFVTVIGSGLLLPTLEKVDGRIKNPNPFVIRPPGALAEEEFKIRCVRCGECFQVCIANALQPALFQAGLDGIFSPLLVARTGYCEFNCTLCGQVCPSGAIRSLDVQEKRQLKIGHAWFDRNRCLPYAKAIPCIVCEEHCPTPDKAIRFKNVEVVNDAGESIQMKQPYVVDELCIGCGICETKCPLPGRAAIYITSAGEHRHPERSLPRIDPYIS